MIAINLSTAQLGDPRLIKSIKEHTRRRGIDPSVLCLEVQESAFNRSPQATLRHLTELRQTGVGIVIDDVTFGSVEYALIEQISPVQLKLARRAVEQLDDPRIRPVIRSLVEVGQQLGFVVVAKGVEHRHHVEAAKSAGCKLVQGHYYSPAQSLESLLADPPLSDAISQ